jgi:methylglutaconyl-CoA hydratase
MRYEHITLEFDAETAVVTLNRPDVRNSMDDQTLRELTHCFKSLAKTPKKSATGIGARVVVIKGNGKDFCAGADVRWMRKAADYPPAKNRKDAYLLAEMIQSIESCPMPVIAVIHGGVYGGGLGVVAACDIVVAEASTRMSFSECRLGILPAVVSSFVLPKIGPSHTRRLYLTSELFGMETAKSIGLVHEVVMEDKLEERTNFFIKNILRNGPMAVRMAKGYLQKMAELSKTARIKFSVETLMKARSSKEGKEGLAAFLEKRAAAWVPVSERSS